MLAFVLVLLILGMGAAALTPRQLQEGGDDPKTTTTATTAPVTPTATPTTAGGTTAPSGPDGERTIAASADDPPLVKAQKGDLLNLDVVVDEPISLQIDGYDEIAPGDPHVPARFSLFLYQAGRFAIRPTTGGATVAELQVR
jgi:hypothetical protein